MDHLVRTRLAADAARVLAEDVSNGAWTLEQLTNADVGDCLAVDLRYADLGLGLADASLFVIAARAGTTAVLSLDHRHLRTVTPLHGGAFALGPQICGVPAS